MSGSDDVGGNHKTLSHRAFVALGSNIDPERNLVEAVRQLRSLGEIAAVSSVYESPPADGSDQPHYLNAAVLLLTPLSAEHLCRESLPDIESALGRIREPQNRNAPRTIDLDLALYDSEVLQIDHRTIPDPDIEQRAFLAIPLAELDADSIHPTSGRTLHQIAATFRNEDAIRIRPDVRLSSQRSDDGTTSS